MVSFVRNFCIKKYFLRSEKEWNVFNRFLLENYGIWGLRVQQIFEDLLKKISEMFRISQNILHSR